MGDESKDKKKLVYEVPQLVKLNGNAGEGDCSNGSSALGTDSTCGTGNVAASDCDTGNTPDQPSCFTGTGGN